MQDVYVESLDTATVTENCENGSEELMLQSVEYNCNLDEVEIPEAVVTAKYTDEEYRIYTECCKRG